MRDESNDEEAGHPLITLIFAFERKKNNLKHPTGADASRADRQ